MKFLFTLMKSQLKDSAPEPSAAQSHHSKNTVTEVDSNMTSASSSAEEYRDQESERQKQENVPQVQL
jgi:hypothetical protein